MPGSPGARGREAWRGGPGGPGARQIPGEKKRALTGVSSHSHHAPHPHPKPQLYVLCDFSHIRVPVGRGSGRERATCGRKSPSARLGGDSALATRPLIFSPENPGAVGQPASQWHPTVPPPPGYRQRAPQRGTGCTQTGMPHGSSKVRADRAVALEACAAWAWLGSRGAHVSGTSCRASEVPIYPGGRSPATHPACTQSNRVLASEEGQLVVRLQDLQPLQPSTHITLLCPLRSFQQHWGCWAPALCTTSSLRSSSANGHPRLSQHLDSLGLRA